MQVRALRGELEKIDALIDATPNETKSGDEDGIIGSTVYTPDDSQSLMEVGVPFDADDDPSRPAEDGSLDPIFEWGADSEEKLNRLGATTDEEIRQSVQVKSGSDALGYYLSFHVRGAQWGATVKMSGLAWLVTNYFQDLPVDALTRCMLAFHAILQHELFHFATDVAITQAELSQKQAWWRPAREARSARKQQYSYREEMLANTWMLRAFRTALPGFRVRGKQAALKAFVGSQPPGYRDALGFMADRWNGELRDLAYEYALDAGCQDGNELLWGNAYNWPCQFPVSGHIDWRNCAINLVDDSKLFGVPPGWLTFFASLNWIEESPMFRKQLAALGREQQRHWAQTKRRAEAALTHGHDFKPWPKGGADVWSLRVDRACRAHLMRDRTSNTWIALEIGDHKAMGHG